MFDDNSTFEEDAQIDLHSLHTELQFNPSLIGKWRKKYAIAKAEESMLSEQLPILKAEAKSEFERKIAVLELALRDDWESYFEVEAPKQTEKSVASKLITLPEYVEARETYHKTIADIAEDYATAVENKETLYGACRAMEGKEVSLSELVKLHLSGYYSAKETSLPKEFEDETVRNAKSHIKHGIKKLRR